MERLDFLCAWTLALTLALFLDIPIALCESGGEDLIKGSSLDLAPGWELTPAGDAGDLSAKQPYSNLVSTDDSLLLEQGGRLRSAYVTTSGELRFTESRKCDRLNPVCVGRMGIADTTSIPGNNQLGGIGE